MGWEMWDREDISNMLRSVAVAASTTSNITRDHSEPDGAQREAYLAGYLAALLAVSEAFGLGHSVKREISERLSFWVQKPGWQPPQIG